MWRQMSMRRLPRKTEVDEPPFFPELIAELKQDEGCKLHAYKDTRGIWTIGYGHATKDIHEGLVWTQAQADAQLHADALNHGLELEYYLPWMVTLDSVRRRVLWNMAFNLGVNGLLAFKNTLAMVKSGNYIGAAGGMLASKWATQVPNRAKRLARHMELGI